MLNSVQTSEMAAFSVFPSQESSPEPLLVGTACPIAFPLAAVALKQYPRISAWAGLAEAGQILCEAEVHKGTPLSQEELRTLMELHLDAYEPTWSFGRAGISEEWLSGWCRAFALYAQQAERVRYAEPLHSIGLESGAGPSPASGDRKPPHRVRFRQVVLQVYNAEAFQQGVWQGQMAGVNEQESCACGSLGSDATPGTVSSVRFFDEVLDLVSETGNLPLDYVVGYLLAYGDALLCRRQRYPTLDQVGVHPE